ncbi:MAG: hypothetical protein JNL74_20960 [Fibrobacteres bacterium]|nr:hypothetical protein [Fibrobacterota bacterium]
MITKLKEYKELIAILVFFLGGFFWLNNRFSTKSDLQQEIASLNCMLEKYMLLTQNQIRVQTLEKEINETNSKLSLMMNTNGGVSLSPAMEYEIGETKNQLTQKKSELSKCQSTIQDICLDLQRNSCGKVKQ